MADNAWAEHTDAYQLGRDSRDAEVAALRERIRKLRAGIEDALAAHELTANGPAQTVIEDVQGALDEDAAASKAATDG